MELVGSLNVRVLITLLQDVMEHVNLTSLDVQVTSLAVLHLLTVADAKLFYPQKIEAVLYLLTNGIGRRFTN